MYQMFKSELDDSVNFSKKTINGLIESRYVRRNKDKVAFYISTATGCNQLCKFCHLTATKQFKTVYLETNEILDQINTLANYYQLHSAPAKKIHVNFMARGEPLLNKYITLNNNLSRNVKESVSCEINISTIMPRNIKYYDQFENPDYNFYYSLYSTNSNFRSKSMPNAMPIKSALLLLSGHQKDTNNLLTIHHALIKGENDSADEAKRILELIYKYLHPGRTRISLIAYNPYDSESGVESDRYSQYMEQIQNANIQVKKIDRVGEDVKASCGMFLNV